MGMLDLQMRLNMELRWTVGYHGGLCIISPAQPGSQRPVRPCRSISNLRTITETSRQFEIFW